MECFKEKFIEKIKKQMIFLIVPSRISSNNFISEKFHFINISDGEKYDKKT